MTVFAVILSGGSGNRFGEDLPKQFSEVYGKTILDYCISKFNNHNLIDNIIVVGNPDHIQRTQQIANKNKYKKIVSVIEGGPTRSESSFIGISEAFKQSSDPENDIILIQDGVRPNTSAEIISKTIESLQIYNAVSVAIQSTDTIYIIDENKNIIEIPNRSSIYKAQTPQGFKLNTIYKAYNKIEKVLRFSFTDDCGLLNAAFPNEKIYIINGDSNNIKITFSEDIELFRQLIQNK